MLRSLSSVLFWLATVAAFVLASLPEAPQLPGNPSDKTLHALAFLTLAILAAFAFPRKRLVVLFLWLGMFGGAIELVQSMPQIGREASWLDWLTDLGAAGLVLLVFGMLRALFGQRSPDGQLPRDT